MPTIQQLVRKGRVTLEKKSKSAALDPQKSGGEILFLPTSNHVEEHANDPTTSPQRTRNPGKEEQVGRTGRLPATPWRLHPGIHHYSKEAEFRDAQSCACTVN